jgi:hypothetical protein
MENRLPTGPGSRGGRWHEPEFRRAYHRAWRAAHPEYRERERLRRRMGRGMDVGLCPAGVDTRRPATFPRPAEPCACGCGCAEAVVVVCGFCRDGLCERGVPATRHGHGGGSRPA